jgi:hypothetical protein
MPLHRRSRSASRSSEPPPSVRWGVSLQDCLREDFIERAIEAVSKSLQQREYFPLKFSRGQY